MNLMKFLNLCSLLFFKEEGERIILNRKLLRIFQRNKKLTLRW